MPFDNLLVEREGNIVVLTVHRPERLNALDSRTLEELRQAFLDFQQDPLIRSIVVTGAGDKAFVAGADIAEIALDSPQTARDRARGGQRVFDLIEQLGKPVVAAVNGYALGRGCGVGRSAERRAGREG